MRFSEAKNRKVVSTSGAATVGKIRRFIVDPRSISVAAIILRTNKNVDGSNDTVFWGDLKAFGRDAVTIESTDVITRPEGDFELLADKEHRVLGKRVLSDGGNDLGEVKDVEFDPANGRVRALLTGSEEIDGDRILGLGPYALVVRSS
jgi:sporulation protein YlmC with PRC-barrel domain